MPQLRMLQIMGSLDRCFSIGDVIDFSAEEAGRLIEAGIAEPVEATKVETATAPKGKK